MTVATAFDATSIDCPGSGKSLGNAASQKVSLYGATPVIRRAYTSSLHATAAMVTSAGSLFQATHVAQIQEIQKTLIGLGIWATA